MTTQAPRFPTPDEIDWRSLAQAALGGRDLNTLRARTVDGLTIEPLYRETDFPAALDPVGFPGAAPFVRGGAANMAPAYPWDLRVRCDAKAGPDAGCGAILEELEGGASSICLIKADEASIPACLAGMYVDLAPVALDRSTGAAARALADHLLAHGGAAVAHEFGLPPADADCAHALAARFQAATLFCADARPVHEAGGSHVQEIAAALAAGIACMRAAEQVGLAPDAAAPRILFRVGVETDILLECAKLRALRLCWARVCEASGVAPERRLAKIEASTSGRMLTRRDAWTNILRVTAATFAAAIGGAQAIIAAPFTDAIGAATPFARRLARNTQHVLMREAGLGCVADPAGGAWAVEAITQHMAEAGWALMQGVEAAGGWLSEAGRALLAHEVAGVRERRLAAVATRRDIVTGVTDFPQLGARAPETAGALAREPEDPLFPRVRWAADFEDLADAGEAAGARAFVAVLGPLAEAGPRAQYAAILLATGGVQPIGADVAHASPEALCAAFRESGASVAILAGADGRYDQEGQTAARALKAAGCVWLALAGRPAEAGALEAAGVDQMLVAGMDALAALRTLHAAAGVARKAA